MLMRRWERARQGDGQLVMIVGEPGFGESRLIQEFHHRLREVSTLGRMELLAASAKHAAAPDHRVGPPALRRLRRPRGTASRRPGEYAGAGQARPGGERPVAGVDAGHSAAVGTRADFAARGIATPAANSPHQFGDGRRVLTQRCWHLKMCIGLIRQRSISCAASPTRRAGAFVRSQHRPARVPAFLGRALASQHDLPGSA